MSTFPAFIADSLFQELDKDLNRPDCKTARQRVANKRVIYALRHSHEHNPLNIRITRKEKIKCAVRLTLTAAAGCFMILALSVFSITVFEQAESRAKQWTFPQTTTAPLEILPDGETEFYSPEEQ